MCYATMISQHPECVSLHMVHSLKDKLCTSKQFGHGLVGFVFSVRVCLLIGVAKSHEKCGDLFCVVAFSELSCGCTLVD